MTLSLTALLILLGTSFGWSVLDLLRKMLVREIRPVALLFLLAMAQAAVFVVWVVLDPEPRLEAGYFLPALGSVVLNVVANVAFIEALSLAPLSLTVPLLSLTPALAALVSIPLVGELPSPLHFAGIFLVVLGALYLNLGSSWASFAALARALYQNRGTQLMVLVAVMWSLAMPLDKLALQASSSSVHALGLSAGVGLGCLLILALRGQVSDLLAVRRAPGLATAGIAVSSLATALQLIALTMIWVSLVETLKRAIGNVLAIVFGRWLFAEAITAHKVAAVALMVVGVVLISL